ncbi:UNVERIFIED_CONTAM: hypothetical protein FKN15_014515 [Acipenser sinensis]
MVGVMCGPNGSFLSLRQAPQGKKARRANTKTPGSTPNLGKDLKEVKARRRKKSLGENKGHLSESSVTLSPVDSLESPHAYISDNSSHPHLTAPGAQQHPQHTLSLANLSEQHAYSHGSSTILPPVSHMLSQHGLGMGRAGQHSPSEWMGLPNSGYGHMFGVLHHHQAAGSHPSMHQQGMMAPMNITMAREQLPSIVAFQMMPNSVSQQHVNHQQQQQQQHRPSPPVQNHCAQNMGGSLYQGSDMGHPAAQMPNNLMPQQDGQRVAALPQYQPLQSSVDKYPTPPSQHSYPSTSENTPGHSKPGPSEHPYLTPSPESPDQWSSSSPHSASDWSDVTTSPTSMSQLQPSGAHIPEQQRSSMQAFA